MTPFRSPAHSVEDYRQVVAKALALGWATKRVPVEFDQSRQLPWPVKVKGASKLTPAICMARRRAELRGQDTSRFPKRSRKRKTTT